ncbi:MAG: SMC-Scp complex subunit ScpB [Actinobacteria bacterium]|nr:SMC-Scp complex subunit ScpB [Actinomycetota bacterium]
MSDELVVEGGAEGAAEVFAEGGAERDAERVPADPRPEVPDPVAGVPETHRLALPAKIEALLFLSPDPLTVAQLVEACESSESQVEQALSALEEDCQAGQRGVVLRRISGGYTLASAPGSDAAARCLFAKPRTPPLTQAQAECLAVIAYLQPVSRPEIARIRGVSSESALGTLLERGLIADAGRSQFGAVIFKTTELFDRLFGLEGLDALPDVGAFKTTELFDRLFGLEGLDALPDVGAFDPSPDDERDLRERLLKAGEQREAASPQPQG